MNDTDEGVVLGSKWKILLPDDEGNIPIITRYLILTGGRGSGKSFALSVCLTAIMQFIGYTSLFCRWTMASAKDSIIPEFRSKTDLLGIADEFRETTQDVEHVLTKSLLMFRGIKTSAGNQTAKLKSLHGVNIFVLDEAEEMPDEATFDTIDLSVRDRRRKNLVILCLNPTHKKHWIHRRFFEDRRIPDEGFTGVCGDATYIHSTYLDNWANLPEDYRAKAESAKLGDPRRYKSVWLGSWMEEVIGALWSYSMIADHRVEMADVPTLTRVGVGIDPNVTYGEDADEAGIVAGGQGTDGHYYILADASGRFGPSDWGRIAVQEYDKWKADKVIGEANNGGDLVRENVEKFRSHIPFLKVNASRGKIPRAAPIATLSAQGMIHFVGRFPELEAEMMSYTGLDPNKASPNRMDAFVWLMSWLAQILPGDEVGAAEAERQRRMRTMGAE